MDALVENVSAVMAALDRHHARELVDVNVVFERLEILNERCKSEEELVQRVTQSFLRELDLISIDNKPEVEVVGEVNVAASSSIKTSDSVKHGKPESHIAEKVNEAASSSATTSESVKNGKPVSATVEKAKEATSSSTSSKSNDSAEEEQINHHLVDLLEEIERADGEVQLKASSGENGVDNAEGHSALLPLPEESSSSSMSIKAPDVEPIDHYKSASSTSLGIKSTSNSSPTEDLSIVTKNVDSDTSNDGTESKVEASMKNDGTTEVNLFSHNLVKNESPTEASHPTFSQLRKESPTEMKVLSPGLASTFDEEPFSPLTPANKDEVQGTAASTELKSNVSSAIVGSSKASASGSDLGAIPKATDVNWKASNIGAKVSGLHDYVKDDELDYEPEIPSTSSTTRVSPVKYTLSGPSNVRRFKVREVKHSVPGTSNVRTHFESGGLNDAFVENGNVDHSMDYSATVPDSLILSPNKRSLSGPSNVKNKVKVIEKGRGVILVPTGKSKMKNVPNYVATLSEMFPEADPQYLWDRCEELEDEDALNALITTMLMDNDYPRVSRYKPNKNIPAAAGSAKDLVPNPSPVKKIKIPIHSSGLAVTHENLPSSSKTSIKLESATTTSAVSSSASTSNNGYASKTNTVVKQEKPMEKVKQTLTLDEIKRKMAKENNEAIITPVPREPWQDQYEMFVQILPDADPSYLEEKARFLFGKEEEIRLFVADALEKKEYPSRKDWLWRQEQLALLKKYTEEFSIPNFLEIIPDPFTYFSDSKRQCNQNMGNMFLRNKYRKLRVADITETFKSKNYNLTLTCKALDAWTGQTLKGRRGQAEYDLKKEGGKDLQFLQEVAFIEHEKNIVQYLEDKKKRKEDAFNEAKAKGELLECQCCFDDEILFEDIRTCTEGHTFCVSCVIKSSEQRIGEGHTTFPCLADCTAEFKLQTLQEILKPTVFSRMVQRKQAEEVKAAGIEDLVQCPFCDFCNIPPVEDKVFRCLNPDCMKESCRLCKEESHIPLRCEEVERKSEVEMRTYIENKMTEALVRTCWKCQKKFVKEDGCNKMRCQCGALMCYVCRQPVQDYSHFNGQGGDALDKCPLWSNNNDLHVDAVAKVAQQAKEEALAKNPTAKLVHDPTANLPKADPRQDHPLPDNVLHMYVQQAIPRLQQRAVNADRLIRGLQALVPGAREQHIRDLVNQRVAQVNVRVREGRAQLVPQPAHARQLAFVPPPAHAPARQPAQVYQPAPARQPAPAHQPAPVIRPAVLQQAPGHQQVPVFQDAPQAYPLFHAPGVIPLRPYVPWAPPADILGNDPLFANIRPQYLAGNPNQHPNNMGFDQRQHQP